MPASSEDFRSLSFVEILQTLVDTKKTGYLRMKDGDQEGYLAVENGVIINAKIGSYTALHALFQFVGWRETKYDFHERPIPQELSRDLAVYEAHVLITGVAFKVEELTLLQQAIPSIDAIPHYMGGQAPAAFEATPADLGLLSLADGRRTVREIADKVMMSPLEVARNLARFRLAGVLKLVKPTKSSPRGKSALATAAATS